MEPKSSVPNIAVEAAFSVLKWALIILVINNALWAAIHYGDTKRPSHNTEISVVQDGTSNSVTQPSIGGNS